MPETGDRYTTNIETLLAGSIPAKQLRIIKIDMDTDTIQSFIFDGEELMK